MPLRVVTPPTPDQEPISLEEAKAHLRVDFIDDDDYITALISVAREYAEGFQNRCLAPTTLELSLDYFATPIKLLRLPVASVTSVKYTLSDNTVVTVSDNDYIVTSNGFITPGYGKFWPPDILVPMEGVKVVYTAGYTAELLPKTTKQAMLMLIGGWYENRESIVVGKVPVSTPFAVQSLLWMDRSWY